MRKFLASVGNAKLLGKVNGVLKHIADVRTLTESTLSFSNTMEEVRAGQGAQLYGRFAHDSGMTVTLTDAMFDMEYIAQQTGALNLTNPTAFAHEPIHTVDSSDFTTGIPLTKGEAQSLGTACGLEDKVAWVRLVDCKKEEEVKMIKVSDSNKVVLDNNDFKAGDKVCVDYFVTKPGQRGLSIAANFIPAELILILTTKLFAGDSKAPETGRPVGEITVKIPRFSLDGTFDLSMAMSSAATMSLAGTALAVDDGTCDGNGIYAEIIEVIDEASIVTNIVDIVIDPESAVAGSAPVVLGKFKNGTYSTIPSEYVKLYNGGSFKTTADSTFAAGTDAVVVYDPSDETALPTSGSVNVQKASQPVNYGTNSKPAYYFAESIDI